MDSSKEFFCGRLAEHQSLLDCLIDKKYTSSCCQLLVSYACYHFSSFLQLVSKYHGRWVQCRQNEVKQGLKSPLLIFLSPIMLQYLGLRLTCSVCGASMGIYIIHINFGAAHSSIIWNNIIFQILFPNLNHFNPRLKFHIDRDSCKVSNPISHISWMTHWW